MTKIKNTGAAKNTEAVDAIQKQEVLMKKNYAKNDQKLKLMNTDYVNL